MSATETARERNRLRIASSICCWGLSKVMVMPAGSSTVFASSSLTFRS